MPRFSCDYGFNIRAGRHLFVNYDCIFLDVAPIEIGDDVQIAPAVQLYTATHPLDPAVRRSGLASGRPICIGDNVWIGGGAIILPGVTVGDDAVIGAGSVVTVSYTHLRAHETPEHLVCRLLLEKKKQKIKTTQNTA